MNILSFGYRTLLKGDNCAQTTKKKVLKNFKKFRKIENLEEKDTQKESDWKTVFENRGGRAGPRRLRGLETSACLTMIFFNARK